MARQFKATVYPRRWTTNGKEHEAWGVRYRLNGKYRSEIIGPKKTHAEARARQLYKDHEERVLGVAEGKTFADLSPLFVDHKRRQERHMEAIELRVRNLAKQFDGVPLEDITAESIDRYISKREGEGVKNATINRELAVLRHMLRLAVRKWKWLRQEPFFEMLPEGAGRDRELTEAEEKALLPHLNPALRDLLQAALVTGMREGELLRLEWPQVNLTERVLDFPPTKRGKKRLMPISESLFYVLARRKQTPSTSGRVFVKQDGEPWTKHAVRYYLDKGAAAAGVKGFTFHDTRHTFSSRLVRGGVHAVYVQELLGHKSSKTTERYMHAQTSDLQAAVGTLENLTNPGHGSEQDVTIPRNSAK